MKNKTYLYDTLLIIGVLCLALGSYLLYSSAGESGDRVIVKHMDEVIGTYDLNKDGEYVLNGGTNTIIIENGKVYMAEADCPDKLCINQGKISKANQCITCLPNKITVTVKSEDKEVDLVS